MAITSSMEANTTVLFEAMENCVPVITVDHCGMADVVKDGVTGIKVKMQTSSIFRAKSSAIFSKACILTFIPVTPSFTTSAMPQWSTVMTGTQFS
ncbi:glycosyltransferase, partial [Parabacteroides distasonis]